MNIQNLISTLVNLTALPQETEWVEFKHNFHSPEEIGERISALSNSATLTDKPYGYLVFGVEDETHEIVGTTFKVKRQKKGNEELEMWLLNRLNPRLDVGIYEFDYAGKHISLFQIPASTDRPVTFLNVAYIRVGSLTKKLISYPEKEKKLWQHNETRPLYKTVARVCKNLNEVISLLSAESYFDRLELPMPQNSEGIISRFISEKFVTLIDGNYCITKLGALLLAKHLRDFDTLYRKAVRVIVYNGKNKVETIREQIFEQGYAVCFVNLLDWVNGQLPANEEIGRALRKDV
ncbi:MAG: putative DNA binding domain-containing protein, partial [Muribaculaceae bacterium]|nr:putative DNA binding domain-containing protein [Muribaculaceae bacterium]